MTFLQTNDVVSPWRHVCTTGLEFKNEDNCLFKEILNSWLLNAIKPFVDPAEKISRDERWKIRRRAEFAILKLRCGRVQCGESVKHSEIISLVPALNTAKVKGQKLP